MSEFFYDIYILLFFVLETRTQSPPYALCFEDRAIMHILYSKNCTRTMIILSANTISHINYRKKVHIIIYDELFLKFFIKIVRILRLKSYNIYWRGSGLL